jgi:hypothetical protein
MWDTNLAEVSAKIYCDDDCRQSGCPGHTVQIKVHGSSGRGEYFKDGNSVFSMDRNEAEQLLNFLTTVQQS